MSQQSIEVFNRACSEGNIESLQLLGEQHPHLLPAMIAADNFHAFRVAAKGGYLNILQYLVEHAPAQVEAMIAADNFHAFQIAAEEGYEDEYYNIFIYLIEIAQEQLPAMIAANDFYAFRIAAENGNIKILEALKQFAPEQVTAMIAADDFYAFRTAAEHGYIHVLEYLVELAPEQVTAMIAADDFYAFRVAAEVEDEDEDEDEKWSVIILKYLAELSPAQLPAMIAADNFNAFHVAAQNGNLNILQCLAQLALEQVDDMIAADDFYAFRIAAEDGNIEILRYLTELSPAQVPDMIESRDFYAFQFGAENGHLNILQYLTELAPELVPAMIAADNFAAFQYAFDKKHNDIIEFLLHYNHVLEYVEHHREYWVDAFIPYLRKRLSNLLLRKQNFEQSHPEEIFDVSVIEADAFHIFWRHFINFRNPQTFPICQTLSQIPAIRALAHRNGNELLRVAIHRGNRENCALLLAIPAVRELAEANQMYFMEDPENSIRSLTQDEIARFEAALRTYQPILVEKNVTTIIAELKEDLRARYERDPAKLGDVSLPFAFSDFKVIALSPAEEVLALQAYYQNKAHTAWRYLSIPNPWMHPEADFVERNPETGFGNAIFMGYLPLIAMLYEAAKDSSSPPVDGYTIDTRVESLVHELALINRAHNWDRYRINEQTQNQEQYDDFEGDKPSCYSGAKLRLLQAVQGHTLFKVLTEEDIRELIISEFRRRIVEVLTNPKTCERIQSIWDNLTETAELSADEVEYSKSFNFSPAEQAEFLSGLSEQYGSQFSQVLRAFALQEFAKENHLIDWSIPINLISLLMQAKESTATHGFFSAAANNTSADAFEPAAKRKP